MLQSVGVVTSMANRLVFTFKPTRMVGSPTGFFFIGLKKGVT